MRKIIDFIELAICLALTYPTHSRWKNTIKKVRKDQQFKNERREVDKKIKRESKMLRNTKG